MIVIALLLSCGCGGRAEELCPGGGPAYTPPQRFVPPGAAEDLARFVDPMIGTGGSGNAIPGALVPHGMVRLSPDTLSERAAIGSYYYKDTRIEGFTHTNLEGPGGSGNGYSQVLLMPGVGTLADPQDASSAFSHDEEHAEPGRYRVLLADPGIDVELSATAHAGIHRYTFPARDDAWIDINLGHTKGVSKGGAIEVAGNRVVRGFALYQVHPLIALVLGPKVPTGMAKVFFHVETSRPFRSFAVWGPEGRLDGTRKLEGAEIGAVVGFDATADPVVEARVGISLVSADQARRNMEAEIGAASLDEVAARARAAWNEALGRVVVESDDEALLTQLYTALYHSFFQPADYTEQGGCHVNGASGQPVVVPGGGRPYYTDDWCMWDTYRTLHPLGTIVEPEIRADVVTSMLETYGQGGWLEKCSWHATGYSRVMTGNPQVAVIADAWTKGLTGFDEQLAWEAMLKTSMQESEQKFEGICGYFGLGTPPEYIASGFVGYECDKTQAASMTLEIAYADSCMARVAALTGRGADEETFRARAQNFRNQWNPATGFMQPRWRSGEWVEPFDPASTDTYSGFVESSAWTFAFFVPHDVPALIGLMGGEEAFVAKLDEFFDGGFFEASNEPGFQVPWLYNYAGRPDRTQERVREILARSFSTGPDGLPGNDDSGAMSAWYVFAALGLYPVAPGDPAYQLSTPLAGRATIYLNPAHYGGGAFTIETAGEPGGAYIVAADLDGAPLDRTFVTHDELAAGGTLRLTLGAAPAGWGTGGAQ